VPSAANALQPPDDIPVIDLNAAEVTCPACGHTFDTGPSECPDCGLFIG
jgi:rubrerythrin